MSTAQARAHANIALAKYWGKSDLEHNIPATPSISLTLAELYTDTRVTFRPELDHDVVILNGEPARDSDHARVCAALDRVRQRADISHRAQVESKNNFPTAAGLASSASGFAALISAACTASKADISLTERSAIARACSASAARSFFGGFAELPAGEPGAADLAAHALAPESHWDVRMVLGVMTSERKAVGSTEGMERSRLSSPLYASWVEHAPRMADVIRDGIRARDINQVGQAMEQSTFAFHSCALTSAPFIAYWMPATLAAIHALRALRDREDVPVWLTMDAGPHVKALCLAQDVARVEQCLGSCEGVQRVLVAKPGPEIQVRA